MGSGELKLMHLFPSSVRVFAWVKNTAAPRPGIWPTFAWEPLVVWGKLPGKEEQRAVGKTPNDWAQFSSARSADIQHETPKPVAFAEWVISVTLGPRRGRVCELFAGTAPISRSAVPMGMEAIAVDLTDYLSRETA
jgi:hypothetical protein